MCSFCYRNSSKSSRLISPKLEALAIVLGVARCIPVGFPPTWRTMSVRVMFLMNMEYFISLAQNSHPLNFHPFPKKKGEEKKPLPSVGKLHTYFTGRYNLVQNQQSDWNSPGDSVPSVPHRSSFLLNCFPPPYRLLQEKERKKTTKIVTY